MSSSGVPVETLRQIPILRGLDDEEYQRLAQVARLEEFPGGADVLKQGAACQNLWVMLEGECDVVKEWTDAAGTREIVLATLRPLENFGEMSFFQAAPHSAAVRARGPVKLLRLTREDYEKLLAHGNGAAYKLAYNTVHSLADRLRRMFEVTTQDVHRAPCDS
jgi:CRP-like cAMP-binding protein